MYFTDYIVLAQTLPNGTQNTIAPLDVLLGTILTISAYYLTKVIKERFPEAFPQQKKEIIVKPDPNLTTQDLNSIKEDITMILAQGILRSSQSLEEMLVKSVRLSEEYRLKNEELEERNEALSELVESLEQELSNCNKRYTLGPDNN